ncbi:cadmium-translocating P-type ATPase, partial [Pseudomonas syringae pv. actinidiae ICMP 19096]
MGTTIKNPPAHDHDHDHDHGAHEHEHKSPEPAHSCCSSDAQPAVVTFTDGPTSASRLSNFRIEAMDCPTEQTLIQNKLGKLAGVQKLEFNLINRLLGVWHDLPSTDPIREAISSLGMQADPVEEGAAPAAS